MRGILSDVRYAIRLLLKNPGFSLVAAVSLALGIGANTAIFTLLDAVLLRNLPVRNPRELVLFGKGTGRGITDDLPNRPTQLFSHPFYRELREKNQVFSDVLALQSFGTRAHVRISGGATPTMLKMVPPIVIVRFRTARSMPKMRRQHA